MGLQKVWVVDGACCNERVSSAGAYKGSAGEVHIIAAQSCCLKWVTVWRI